MLNIFISLNHFSLIMAVHFFPITSPKVMRLYSIFRESDRRKSTLEMP